MVRKSASKSVERACAWAIASKADAALDGRYDSTSSEEEEEMRAVPRGCLGKVGAAMVASAKAGEDEYARPDGERSSVVDQAQFRNLQVGVGYRASFVVRQPGSEPPPAPAAKRRREPEAPAAPPKKAKKEKKDKKKKKHKSKDDAPAAAAGGGGGGGGGEDVEWHTDTSAEAVQARQMAEMARLSERDRAAEDGDVEEDMTATDEAVERLQAFFASGAAVAEAAILNKVKEVQTNSGFKRTDAPVLYFLSAFGDNLVAEVQDEAKTVVLQKLIEDSGASELAQKQLMDAIAYRTAVKTPALLKLTPVIMMHLYNADILEEEAVLPWFNQEKTSGRGLSAIAGKSAREAAAAFVSMIESDGESSSDEDED